MLPTEATAAVIAQNTNPADPNDHTGKIHDPTILIDDDGKIVTDTEFLDKHGEYGVGQYSADWDRIEAEWYYAKSPAIEKTCNRNQGFEITNMGDGEWLQFANVEFPREVSQTEILVSNAAKGGTIEMRSGSLSGNLLGTIQLESSDEKQNAVNDISVAKDKHHIFLI